MSKIIAISNQKGGVAKTTTCMSLGAGLAELGQRVLVVDLDSQANLTVAAGLDDEALAWSIADLLAAEGDTPAEAAEAVICPTAMAGLKILPADLRLAGTERLLYDKPDYEFRLAEILSRWENVYDIILLDCPPSLGAITLMALTAARYVVAPVQCEYYAARGLNRLLDIVGAVKDRTNPDLRIFLLATLYDQRNKICREILGRLQTHFSDTMLKTVIGIDTRLRESPIAGVPVLLYAPSTRASRHYRALAQEIMVKTADHRPA